MQHTHPHSSIANVDGLFACDVALCDAGAIKLFEKKGRERRHDKDCPTTCTSNPEEGPIPDPNPAPPSNVPATIAATTTSSATATTTTNVDCIATWIKGECSEPCGPYGVVIWTLDVEVEAQGAGKPCPQLMAPEPCNREVICPGEECTVSENSPKMCQFHPCKAAGDRCCGKYTVPNATSCSACDANGDCYTGLVPTSKAASKKMIEKIEALTSAWPTTVAAGSVHVIEQDWRDGPMLYPIFAESDFHPTSNVAGIANNTDGNLSKPSGNLDTFELEIELVWLDAAQTAELSSAAPTLGEHPPTVLLAAQGEGKITDDAVGRRNGGPGKAFVLLSGPLRTKLVVVLAPSNPGRYQGWLLITNVGGRATRYKRKVSARFDQLVVLEWNLTVTEAGGDSEFKTESMSAAAKWTIGVLVRAALPFLL
jgi:hypothetical protein